MSTPSDNPADEAIRSIPHVRSVALHDDGGLPLAVVIVDAVARRERPALREEIVRKAASAGVAVRPAVYDEKEWDEVGRLLPTDGRDIVAPALARQRSVDPGGVRPVTIRIVRDLRMALDAITEPQPILYHHKLEMCARLVRDGMRILFAMKDQPFTADAAAVAAFDREFVADGFPARHGTLYLRLSGLARQAELAYWATARDGERRFPADAEIDEAEDFLRLLEHHVGRSLTSDAERAHDTRMKRLGVAVIGPLVALLGLGYLAATRPERPLVNTGAITAPGAIGVEYFAGESFDHKILERADTEIAVSADTEPDPRLQSERWSARWNGYLLFDQPGRWHLCARADDGSQRIYLNNRLLVDDWTHSERQTACATVNVAVGWYPLRVEYHQGTGTKAFSILRGPPRRSLAAIPSAALCCGTNTPVS